MKTDRKKAEINFFLEKSTILQKGGSVMEAREGMVGFRIAPDWPRPPLELAAALEALGTPAISDGMNHFNTMDPAIKPILERRSIAGPAATLRLRPGDNLMLHKSLGLVRPGDVLVVDTCGCTTSSILGELIATAAFQAGLAGIVIDGGIRDIQQLKEKAYPIFARFVTPAVGGKDGPGEFGYPISCGGVPVHPGDLIVGDENGVVVIPPADAEKVLADGRKKRSYEETRMAEIKRGVLVKPAIDDTLRAKGVIS